MQRSTSTLTDSLGVQPLERYKTELRSRLDQLRTLDTLTSLLPKLCRLVRDTIRFPNVGITLRYRRSDWFELAYLCLGDEEVVPGIFQRGRVGLSSLVIDECVFIVSDSYRDECVRRGVESLEHLFACPIHAMMSAPLCAQGETFGALFAFSAEPDQPIDADDLALFTWLSSEFGPIVRMVQRYVWAIEEVAWREALINITRAINSSLDPEAVLTLILERAPALLNAEASSLLLLDQATGELVFHYAVGPIGPQLVGFRIPPGAGIAGHVVRTGQATIVNDTSSDSRCYRNPSFTQQFTTRSILAVPLRKQTQIGGVIEVLNRRHSAPFIDEDRIILEALADQAIIALENANRLASLDKEVECLRTDLVNMMIHDLRSPLTGVMTAIDMMFRGITGEISMVQREILSIAYTSAQNMLNMVNLLLDISRLESRLMPLHRKVVHLPTLFKRVLFSMGMMAQSRQIMIEQQLDPEACFIFADEDLLLRVLQNLLDNALKFSPNGSSIQLCSKIISCDPAQHPVVCIVVRDEGVGIQPSDQQRIFDKFTQVGRRYATGSGLGLTFCKLVLEAHGGQIWVESAPEAGSSFFLVLPRPEA
jgi:signal transduction histidine kinase